MAPFNVQSKFEDIAPHIEGSNADFSLHMEGSHADFTPQTERQHSFSEQKIAKIANSANFQI